MDSIVYEASQCANERIAHATRVAVELEGMPPREYTRLQARELIYNILECGIVSRLGVVVVLSIRTLEGEERSTRNFLSELALRQEDEKLSRSRSAAWRHHWQGNQISVRFRFPPT